MSALSIFAPHRFLRVMWSDALNVGRDPMLAFGIAMSLLPVAAFHLFAASLDDAMLGAFGVAGFSRLLVPLVLVLPAALIGWVTGFLLLEDRDEGPLMALDVTPVGKTGFLAYRGTIAALAAGAITAIGLATMAPELPLERAITIIVLVGAEAVLATLILPAVARNKVEGLALTKLTNLLAIVPLICFVPSAWRLAAGMVPTYWIGELMLPEPAAGFWLSAGVAAAVHLACGVLLLRLFNRRVG